MATEAGFAGSIALVPGVPFRWKQQTLEMWTELHHVHQESLHANVKILTYNVKADWEAFYSQFQF